MAETKKTADVKPAVKEAEAAVKTVAAKPVTAKPVTVPLTTAAVQTTAVEKREEAKAPAKTEVKAPAKAVKKAPVKKTTKATAKPAAKKTTEVKTTGKKPAVKEIINLQFSGKSYTMEDIRKIADDVWKFDLHKNGEAYKSLELYVKPEESIAYYVFNGETTGSFFI